MTTTPAFDYADQQRIIAAMRAKELFFVRGVPKSGTTWLQVMLDAHPEVSCSGEGHFLTHLAPLLTSAMERYNAAIAHKNRDVLQGFAGFPQFAAQNLGFLVVSAALLLMAASGKARDVRVVGEKTPDSTTDPRALAELFPAAKFIQIVRDPRDCTVSAWFHNQRLDATTLEARFPTLSAFVPHGAQTWCNALGRWDRFAAAVPARCAMVRYEDLVTQPHAELTRLCEFLGVSADPATIRDCVAAGDFARMSGGRPRGIEDRQSLLRQGLPGNWRNHLAPGNVLLCRSIAGETMTRYGYVD